MTATFLALTLLLGSSLCDKDVSIHSADELIEFSNNVNNKMTYEGTTVLLENDITFTKNSSQHFKPIGFYSDHFLGTFNGQGHTIRDLMINSSLQFVGLFGYSSGLTIKNVVMDSSCSVESSYGDSSSFTGGLVGFCAGINSRCVIENSINMADISFTEKTSDNIFIGGISSIIVSDLYTTVVKNCANYGNLHNFGSGKYVFIGGIVGEFSGEEPNNDIINSLNFGTITTSENTISNSVIGGIVGKTSNVAIENCVNEGLFIQNAFSGEIVGSIENETSITHCFWSNKNNTLAYGFKQDYLTVTEIDSGVAELDEILVTELNERAEANEGWNKWLLNKNNNSASFIVNRGKGFMITSQLMLFPSLSEDSGRLFSGWFEDARCTQSFSSTQVQEELSLYGGWKYTVTFDFGNGTKLKKDVIYGRIYETLMKAEMNGYTFAGWFTNKDGGERVTNETSLSAAGDQVFYACWTINSYILTFDFNNGTANSVVLDFNTTIEYPEDILEREEFTFIEWYPKPERMPAGDVTVKAQWDIIKSTEYVEVVFTEKDLTEEDVKEILQCHTKEDFIITNFEVDENTKEIRVIIEFIDKETANEFIRNVNRNKRPEDGIKIVRSVPNFNSFSSAVHPTSLLLFTPF